jgi:hypothetical protein
MPRMADTVISLLKHGIPVGATVRAYPQAKTDEVRRRGDAPSGTPADTDVTDAAGAITLQLTPGIPYWLHAQVSGVNRYIGVVGA